MGSKYERFFAVFFVFLAFFVLSTCENQWQRDVKNHKIVSFNTNGGLPVPANQELFGNDMVFRPFDPVLPGHNFAGWYADNFTFLIPWNFFVSPNGHMTLHAKWETVSAGNTVSSAAITVTTPVAGITPDPEARGEGNFEISEVTWQPSDNPFKKSTQYTASMTLTAHEGYKFADTFSALINGNDAGVSRENDTAVTLSHQFDKTEDRIAVEIEVISQPLNYEYTHDELLDLTGLAVRILYDDDTFLNVSFGEPDWAANGITTSPAHRDTLNRTYNDGLPVRVWLEGLDLAEVYTDKLTVDPAVITSADISIAEPVTGAAPAVSASASGNVTPGEIEWNPNHTVFMGSEIYNVDITIYANANYKFAQTLNNTDMKINGNPVNNVTRNSDISVTLSYQFGITASKTVTRIDITTPPNLTYTHGDSLDLTGLVIKITYNDGSTGNAAFGSQDWAALTGITINYNDGMTLSHTNHHNYNIWITYSGKQANTNPLIVNPAPITNAAVTVTAPEINKTPDKAADVITAAGGNYAVTDVSWNPQDNLFQGSMLYAVTITLSADADYTFHNAFSGTVNNNAANAIVVNGSIATLSYTFPATAAAVHAQPPSITAQPQGGSYAQNAQVPLTVTAASQDSGTLSYRWYSNNANSSSGGIPVSGAIGASYIPPTASIGTTYYYVIVTNTITDNGDGGDKSVTVTSNVVEINIVEITVTVTNQNNTTTSHANLKNALDSINSAGTYTVTISANQSLESYSFIGSTTRDITLIAHSSLITVQLTGTGRLFNVVSGLTLRLNNGITLRGGNNNYPLVYVSYDGTLYMSGTAAITGNLAGSGNGGGVYNMGTFTMYNGSISGNIVSGGNGGGVCNFSTFTMYDGSISGNNAGNGGGVNNFGTFTMYDGSISGNNAGNGGGVNNSGTFTMYDGSISGNTGHGVYLTGPFIMENGEITGNNGATNGGGVHLATESATFDMKDGTISGNKAVTNGGGVYIINKGTFTMSGGTITGNTSGSYGGGLYVQSLGGTFTKTGLSVITGYSDDSNGNAVKDTSGNPINGRGHAVYAQALNTGTRPVRLREITAGAGVNLNLDNNGDW